MSDIASVKAKARAVYRPYSVDGVPASGPNEPDKGAIIDVLVSMADLAAAAGTTLAFATRAQMLAASTVGLPVGGRAEVRNDPAGEAINGVYRWTGAAWERIGPLIPDSFGDGLLAEIQKDGPAVEASVSLTSEADDVLAQFGRSRSVVLDRETLLTQSITPGDVHTDQDGNRAPPPEGPERNRNRAASRQINPQALAAWRRVAAKVRTGEAQRFCIIGDSTTAGQNTGTGPGGYVGARATSWPTRLVQVLTGRGLNAQSQSWFGGGNAELTVSQAEYDPRLSFGAGWVRAGQATAGGRLYTSGGALTELAFTPELAWDRGIIWVAGVSGAFEVYAGDVLIKTVAAEPAASFVRVDVSAPVGGIMAMRIKPLTTTAVRIAGMEASHSARPALSVINLGWAGSTTPDWINAASPWSALNAVGSLDCDAALIVLGINDWITYYYNQSSYITPAQMVANLKTLVERASHGGTRAVALATSLLSGPNELVTTTHMERYIEAQRDLAALLDIPLIDMAEAFGPWLAASGIGWAEDGIHYNRTAQADMAAQVAVLLP